MLRNVTALHARRLPTMRFDRWGPRDVFLTAAYGAGSSDLAGEIAHASFRLLPISPRRRQDACMVPWRELATAAGEL